MEKDLNQFLLDLDIEAGLAIGEAKEIKDMVSEVHWLRQWKTNYDRIEEVVRGIVSSKLREEQKAVTAAIAAAKKTALRGIDAELRSAIALGATRAQLAEAISRREKIAEIVPYQKARELAGKKYSEFRKEAIASLSVDDQKLLKKGCPRKWAAAHAMSWVLEEVMSSK